MCRRAETPDQLGPVDPRGFQASSALARASDPGRNIGSCLRPITNGVVGPPLGVSQCSIARTLRTDPERLHDMTSSPIESWLEEGPHESITNPATLVLSEVEPQEGELTITSRNVWSSTGLPCGWLETCCDPRLGHRRGPLDAPSRSGTPRRFR